MVRGVERKIVEIRDTGSGCFERAIFFVRADLPLLPGKPTMAEEAARIIDRYCLARGGKLRGRRLPALLRYLCCAAAGAGVASLFWLLVGRI